jgi:hypothetical protein
MCVKCEGIWPNKLNSLFEYHECEETKEVTTFREEFLDNFENENDSDDGSSMDPVNGDLMKISRTVSALIKQHDIKNE